MSRWVWIPPLLLSLAAGVASGVDRFEERIARADSLLVSRNSSASLRILDSLQIEARQERSDSMLLRVCLVEARLHAYAGRPIPGRAAAEEAVRIASARADTLSLCDALRWLAVAAQLEGHFEESRVQAGALVALARSLDDRRREGAGLILLGYADLTEGKSSLAESEYQRAAALLRETGDLRASLMALTGLGRIQASRGDVQGARSSYNLVLEGSRTLENPFGEADALNNLGGLEFTYGDPSLARGYYQEALDLQLRNGNPAGSIVPAKNLALSCTYMGEFEQAAEILLAADRRCDQLGSRIQKAIILEQLGIVRREQRRLGESADLLRRAAILAAGGASEDLGRILIDLVETLQYEDSLEAGIAILQERFEAVRPRVSSELAFKAEKTHGEVLLRLGRHAEALGHFHRADRIGRTSGLGFRVAPLTYAARCHALEGRADSGRFYLRRAVEAWESERARIQNPGWREQMDLDGRLLHTELAHQAFSDASPGPQTDRSRFAFDALQRFKARTLRERMLGAFATPQDVRAEPDAEPVTLAELQDRCLDPDEVLVDFFLGTDGIYLFGVTREECRARRILLDPDRLQTMLRRYRDLAATPPGPDLPSTDTTLLSAAGQRLSTFLLSSIADLLRAHERIVFAPDGFLNMIPMESLPFSAVESDSSSAEPLAAWRSVTRTPSASIFRDQRRRAGSRGPIGSRPRVLALIGGGDPGEKPVPGAYGEVAWLARTYRDVLVLDASADTIASPWRDALVRAEVIHLASHVLTDDVHPWRSGLPELRAQEIAQMRLPVRLAVLAGCESAGGRVVSGEGVLGLTTAFTVATVPSIIATLWPISDRVTARFMKTFYAALAEEKTVGASLLAAQERIRSDPKTSHPFYWAGFVLVGDGNAVIPLRERIPGRTLAAVLGSLALLAALIAARRRKIL